jgi:DNA topoisomerase IB
MADKEAHEGLLDHGIYRHEPRASPGDALAGLRAIVGSQNEMVNLEGHLKAAKDYAAQILAQYTDSQWRPRPRDCRCDDMHNLRERRIVCHMSW